ncbi:MAG: hypothetical protein HQL68_08505 [Magnetococcales bacterium]|nr:hypothetical protein [Magnetococcales bacterium]
MSVVRFRPWAKVTSSGWKWIHLTIATTMKFENPVFSMSWKQKAKKLVEQPSQLEEAYQSINQGFYEISQALAMI